ncbi:amino acid--tRNA ligase-related protein [Staphylococcus aureus]
MDEDYIDAQEYGMPPTAGLVTGLDRLYRVSTDCPLLRDVTLSPYMRQ